MEDTAADLSTRQCKACEGGTPPLPLTEINRYLTGLDGWQHQDGVIAKSYEFKNYYQTIAFVNAIAWISNNQGHHPDLEISYRTCRVSYTTHAIGGLSDNDFICAARVDALFR